MGSSPFQSKTTVTGANTATDSYIPIDDNKITRAEFALAMVEEGIVQVDEDGNIVANGILLRTGTAASLAATELGVGELAFATDSHELFASKNTGSQEVGGYRFGVYQLAPTTVEGETYQLPYARDLYVGKNDLTTLPEEFYPVFAFAPNSSYGLGDRIRIYIHKSTGTTIVGQFLLVLDDGVGNTFYAVDGTTLIPYTYTIDITAEEGVYLDMEVCAFEAGVPVWKIKEKTGLTLSPP